MRREISTVCGWGALAGLLKLHSEHGSLPIETVMTPAIEYAEHGFRVLPGDAGRQAGGARQALEFPGTAAAYYADGSPVRAGDLLVQEGCQLAHTFDGTQGRVLSTVASEQRDVHQSAPAAQVWGAEIGLVS